MRANLAALVPLILLPAAVLTGCGDGNPPEPDGDRLDAGLVGFDPDADTVPGTAATGDAPIDLAVVQGWRATDPRNTFYPGPPSSSGDELQVPDRPGRSYVLVTGSTGCQARGGAELWREGDDLSVRFTGGGEELDECARPYTAVAQFEVDQAALDGVRTVRGTPPLAGAGPGTRIAFLRIGTLGPDVRRTAPAELRGTAPQTMYAALRRAGGRDLEKARAALLREPAAGQRSFGFVLTGCAETGARLLLSRTYLTTQLTGGGNTACDAAEYFLVVYDLPARLVPPKVKLA